MELLQVTWFVLIAVLLAGYAILDGFDLGVGMLHPFLARSEQERRGLFNAIGPFWDGNEVWLLTGGGALFAAFPPAYATIFSGFYTALMLLLFALILRAVSLEFWHHDTHRRSLWGGLFATASFLPSLLFGVALGNIILGIPLNANQDFTGTFWTLLRPFPLISGLLGLLAFLLHGAIYAALKSEGALEIRAILTGRRLALMTAVAVLLTWMAAWIWLPATLLRPLVLLGLGLALLAALLLAVCLRPQKEGRAFFISSVLLGSLWMAVAAALFPNLVVATPPEYSLSLYQISSSALTLKVMLIFALIGMPVVIAYSIYVFRVFRGKTTPATDQGHS